MVARVEALVLWVYENWRAGTHKAVIHTATCGSCKGGTGASGQGTRPDNGRWHGPFRTLERARVARDSLPGLNDP